MRTQEGALNKAAIIILNLTSGLPSSRLPLKPPRFVQLHETFRLPSGSINTVGQALAQLSWRTSDSAPSKRYDLSLDHSASQLLHQTDWNFIDSRGTNSRFRRKYIHTRSSFAYFHLERFTLSDAKPRPAAFVSLACDTFLATFPASLAWKATIHKQNRSLVSVHFFTRTDNAARSRD